MVLKNQLKIEIMKTTKHALLTEKNFVVVGVFTNGVFTSTLHKVAKLNNITIQQVKGMFEGVAGTNYKYTVYAINKEAEQLFWAARNTDGRQIK